MKLVLQVMENQKMNSAAIRKGNAAASGAKKYCSSDPQGKRKQTGRSKLLLPSLLLQSPATSPAGTA